MNLSTVDRVLAVLSATGDAGTKHSDARRAEIAAVLATVSGAVERYLDRGVVQTSRTEYHDVEPGRTIFRLGAWPVASVTGVYFDPDQSWGSTTALDATDYYSPVYDAAGLLRMKSVLSHREVYPRSLKVVYTGGMATDTASFVAAYPDIAGAVDTQVSHEWQRRNALGVSSVNYPDGTTASLSFERWIPSVKQVLDYYRRVS